MTKRLSSKLLAVILTLAICATTVFGCLMTVSAADSWVTFSAGETPNKDDLTKATIKLTVNLPNSAEGFIGNQDGIYGGIVAGTVALDYDSDLALTAVKVDGGTKVDNTYAFDADEFVIEYLENDSNKFLFEASNGDNIYYSQLTFELSFTLTGAKNGDKFSVTASSVEIAGALGGTYGPDAVAGTIVAGCDHKLTPVGEPIVTDTVNGYTVYSDSVCSKCDLHFGKQVVPTKLPGVIDRLVFDEAYIAEGSDSKYYDSVLIDSTDGSETGESWAKAIIIDSAEELSYLTQYIDGTKTKGKYYKVADGISGFDMSCGNIDFDGTLEENLATIDKWGNHNASISNAFQGHFDGNGATVYGLRNRDIDTAGLFPYAMGNVEIKNVNVSLSYLKARYHAGGIVGVYNHDVVEDYSTYAANNKLIIDCCSVTDCYIETTEYGPKAYFPNENVVVATGAIYGGARNATKDASGNWYNGAVNVSNCFIDLDEEYFISVAETQAVQGVHGGIGGCAVTNSSVSSIKDCVVIGISPYSVSNVGVVDGNHQHTFLKAYFSDIYTTAPITAVSGGTNDAQKYQDYTGVMYQISSDEIKGADAATNMPNLDWNVWEIDVNRGYPKFKQAETPDLVNTTSVLGLTLIGTNITYNNGGDYNYNFYYRPDETYTSENVSLYVAQLNEDNTTLGSFHHLTGEVLTADEANAVDERELQEGDIRFTIKRLSAREIYNTLLATAVAVKDGKAFWGDTDEFSIAKYEQEIIDGAYDTDDKNLAEAVLKYGRASKLALNTKNDAASGKTIYWNGSGYDFYDEAYLFYDVETDGLNPDNPIIIDTAEKFACVATAKRDQTAGKYFKIADGIDKIVLQNEEHGKNIVELDSAQAVKDYFETQLAEKGESTFIRWVSKDWNPDRDCFAGHFDGNGVEFYGMYNTTGDINSTCTGDSGGGLFSVAEDATFSNFTVKNSYTNLGLGGAIGNNATNWCFGLIVSFGKDPDANMSDGLTFDRCTVSNNYIRKLNRNTTDAIVQVGIVLGNNYSGPVVMNDLLVYDNITEGYLNTQGGSGTAESPWTWPLETQETYDIPVVGGVSYSGDVSIKNAVILDDVPLVATRQNGTLLDNWKTVQCKSGSDKLDNVYTDWDLNGITGSSVFDLNYFRNSSGNKIINKADAMGMAAMTNMPNLDWTNTWCYGDTYPSLAKGAYASASSGKTIYWNGTVAAKFYQETDGASANNPIIIDTAEKLAYVATATYANTNGKYFKIADGIDKIVLQSETYAEGIIACNSSEAVRDYFESTIASNNKAFYRWASRTWNPATYCFGGNFDGNGVEICGMYNTTGDTNTYFSGDTNSGGGLFSVADNATISNLAIKNSYTNLGNGSNTHTNWSFGLIVSFGKDANSRNDAIIINNCTVANNYIRKNVSDSAMWRTGVVCGSHEAGAFILQNCLVYGNDAMGHLTTADVDYKLGLVGGYGSRAAATDDYKAAHPDWVVDNTHMAFVLENSVVLGTPLLATDTAGTTIKFSQWCVLNALNSGNKNYKNVYTDWDVNNITDDGNFIKDFFLANCGGVVTESDLIGNTAKANEIVGIFNADNGDTVWYTGKGVLLGFDKTAEMLPSAQAIYDAITFKTADNYGANDKTFGVYATSLNLKTNPYISFAFAFSGEYKSNRDKIKVTFGYTVDGTPTTKEVWVADSNGLLDGWSNASNDRFHIYRFQDIPVEALASPITVTVAYNGTEKVTTGTFSAEGFGLELLNAYKQAPSNYYETRIEAVKALLFYTQMLQARYGA